ncbi:spore protease YyaC [Salicibibacter halophilus]|uniref:Spore protease YyaC n=1 Tax=Salicibibacter halophilus TaxID=2502791 RepID=A0A514LIH6_9BACI|nr:spore protease YyaC [Salicibibacter halophilus]QDI91654.1 spore protease YyaC [Salicibibacter halophilus]
MSYKRSFSIDQPFSHPFHVDDIAMEEPLSRLFFEKIKFLPLHRDMVIVCIGTDRSTGDAFGPLTGTMLAENSPRSFHVYGTLQQPVHALNLQETMNHILANYQHPFLIAIDASMGKAQNVGNITFASGPIQPGSAVKKTLPDIGNIHITATVNVGGMMEYFVLQNTRLNLVMKMADRTSDALLRADRRLSRPASHRTTRRSHTFQPSAHEMSAPSKE